VEGDAARESSLGSGKFDGSRDGLDAMTVMMALVMLVFGVNPETNVFRTSYVADKQLSIAFLIDQGGIGGKLKGDGDSSILNIIGVYNVRVAPGQGGVETNKGELMERKFDCRGETIERNASYWMSSGMVMLGKEEASDTENDESGEEPLDGTTKGALLLVVLGVAAALATAEPGPEAAPLGGSADDELQVRFVDGWDGEDKVFLLLDGIL